MLFLIHPKSKLSLNYQIKAGSVQFSSFQSLSRARLFVTPWIAARQASLSITNSQSPPKSMSIESVMPSNHPILCRPLLLLPPIPPNIRVFSSGSTLLIRWPKYWSLNFSISSSNEHPRLISFRMDWLDLLAVQRSLKRLLQHHSSKASILQCSAFFVVQLSYLYMTTEKTVALTKPTYVGKVMSQLSNMLSRLVIAFLPRSKRLRGCSHHPQRLWFCDNFDFDCIKVKVFFLLYLWPTVSLSSVNVSFFTILFRSIFVNVYMYIYWRGKWQLTPVFLPRESCVQRSLVGCCP